MRWKRTAGVAWLYAEIWKDLATSYTYKPLPKKDKKGKKNRKTEKKDDDSESNEKDNTKYHSFKMTLTQMTLNQMVVPKRLLSLRWPPQRMYGKEDGDHQTVKVLGYKNGLAQQHKVYHTPSWKSSRYYNEFFNHHVANNIALPKESQVSHGVVLECPLNKVAIYFGKCSTYQSTLLLVLNSTYISTGNNPKPFWPWRVWQWLAGYANPPTHHPNATNLLRWQKPNNTALHNDITLIQKLPTPAAEPVLIAM